VAESSALGLAAAFAAGMMSFLSPCVLPLVPGYVSYVAGQSHSALTHRRTAHQRLDALALSTVFVLGFGVVFVALGAGASALGELLQRYRYEANFVGGAIVVLFGILMIGMSRGMPWLQREWRFHPDLPGGRPVAAFVLGLAFGFGWTPCIGPVLGAILTLSAAHARGTGGTVLLATYAAGLGVPFLVVAFFTREVAGRMRALRRVGWMLQMVAGAVLIVMGIAMMTGYLSRFGFWLLETFPAFGQLG
jgi:cytochrome c-type biogenesis protein